MNWTRTSDKNRNVYLGLFCIQFYNLHFFLQHEAEIYKQTNVFGFTGENRTQDHKKSHGRYTDDFLAKTHYTSQFTRY